MMGLLVVFVSDNKYFYCVPITPYYVLYDALSLCAYQL